MATKLEVGSSLTNLFFAAVEDKKKIRIAGIIKSIDDKETTSGTAKRFKGDVAVELGDMVYQARYVFFPSVIKDGLITHAAKLGKWDAFEFVLEATRIKNDANNTWSYTFELPPRVEKAKVLSLLEA